MAFSGEYNQQLPKIDWIKTHHEAIAPFNRFKERAYTETAKIFGKRKGAMYIHIPFCVHRCRFCILYSEYPKVPYEHFVNAILMEMRKYRSFQPEVVYFGGGTPTLLPTAELSRILDLIWEIGKPKEITIESTISEFDEKKAKELASLGINRISFGVQNFDNRKRKILGRRAPDTEVLKKLRIAKKYFEIVSIDLLYDLPYGNTLQEDIKKAVELGLDGISVYPMVYNKAMSTYPRPSVEDNEHDFLKVVEYLIEHDYKHLSINHFSNGRDRFFYSEYFTHPEKPLLGIGPGAGGHAENYETFHLPGARRYMMEPDTVNVFSMPKEVFCNLRVIAAVLTGTTEILPENFALSLQVAINEGWAEIKDENLVLLPKGLFWANTLVYLMSLDFLHSYISSTNETRGEVVSPVRYKTSLSKEEVRE